ncbi:MAG: S8 family serine peptidase [bacterium]|nr:S8 family serine peptidase [bacterium]
MKKILALLTLVLFLTPSTVSARLPNDPYAEQWAFKDAQVYEAWDKATGSRDVVVAVIDNGFDTFHPDLYSNVWKNVHEIADNKIDDDNNGYIDDVWGWDFSSYDANGDGIFTDYEQDIGNNNPRPWVVGRQNINDDIHHGSIIAGIIGAMGNNGELGVGINWKVRLMNLKVIEVSGVGDLSPLIRALYYAVNNGADIINISLVGDVDPGVKKAIKYAYDNGVAVIAAAGNDRVALNVSPVYPVCADAGESEQWVLGVTAINKDHYLAPFSNTGASCIDITAPGVNVSSTLRYAPRYGLTRKYSNGWQGTSFAAPIVAGAAALIKSIQPSWGPKQIYEALLSTVQRTPPDDVAAYEEVYGAGLIQIANAVNYALSQIASTHLLNHFYSFDTVNSIAQMNKPGDNEMIKSEVVQIKDVDDSASFGDGFVTVRQTGHSASEVVVYNKNWVKMNSWVVSSLGKLNIAVGDILGDSGVEIVLSPAYNSKNVLRVYDLNGKELTSLSMGTLNKGVSIGLIDASDMKKEILAVYNEGGIVKLKHFDKDLSIIREIVLPFIKNTGVPAGGDIDGDGVQEYIVGAGVGDTPYLAYYNLDGTLRRKFFGYNTDYLGGLDIFAGDYDRDGKDDVFVGPQASEGSIIFWNYRSRKVAEWIFKDGGRMLYMPVF